MELGTFGMDRYDGRRGGSSHEENGIVSDRIDGFWNPAAGIGLCIKTGQGRLGVYAVSARPPKAALAKGTCGDDQMILRR